MMKSQGAEEKCNKRRENRKNKKYGWEELEKKDEKTIIEKNIGRYRKKKENFL